MKIIKGQPMIIGDKLVQSQFDMDKGGVETQTVILENIWDDLLSSDGTYKTNDKGYFYWEVTQTSLEDEDILVKIECPRPKHDTDLDSGEGKWVTYWKSKRAESVGIRPVMHDLKGATYIDPKTAAPKTIPDQSVPDYHPNDLTNILIDLF